MSISFLQQSAFVKSVDFVAQVNAIVVQETLYKVDTTPDLDAYNSGLLASVVRGPEQLGFAQTIIADVAWGVTYDVWAANPTEQDEVIRGGVNKFYELLTGYAPTPPVTEPA